MKRKERKDKMKNKVQTTFVATIESQPELKDKATYKVTGNSKVIKTNQDKSKEKNQDESKETGQDVTVCKFTGKIKVVEQTKKYTDFIIALKKYIITGLYVIVLLGLNIWLDICVFKKVDNLLCYKKCCCMVQALVISMAVINVVSLIITGIYFYKFMDFKIYHENKSFDEESFSRLYGKSDNNKDT